MNVVSIVTAVPDHAQVRERFGRAAYAGLLPRSRWSEAQNLIGRYDDAKDDAVRAALASSMNSIAPFEDPDVRSTMSKLTPDLAG